MYIRTFLHRQYQIPSQLNLLMEDFLLRAKSDVLCRMCG